MTRAIVVGGAKTRRNEYKERKNKESFIFLVLRFCHLLHLEDEYAELIIIFYTYSS
jgi:hypothetical protein